MKQKVLYIYLSVIVVYVYSVQNLLRISLLQNFKLFSYSMYAGMNVCLFERLLCL